MANLLTDSLLSVSISTVGRGRREAVVAVGSSPSVLVQTGRFTVGSDGAVEAGGAGEERLDGVVVMEEEGGG